MADPAPRSAGATSEHRIQVEVPGRAYEVRVGPGTLAGVGSAVAASGARTAALLTHPILAGIAEVVRAGLEAAGVAVVELRMDEGEKAKSWATVGELLERMAVSGMHRDDVVVAVGGGVVTDTGGFSAAAFLRGVRWFSCPTTVLGALDAAVGGKTGVNLRAGKNLAGAFWQPEAVFVDTTVFASLPPRQVRSGLAEAVKCGWIADPAILDLVEAWGPEPDPAALAADPHGLTDVVARGIEVKAAVVAADEREGGLRAILNYGHTLGHALETASDYGLTHGEAISVGMVFAAELAHLRGTLGQHDVGRHRRLLAALGLPVAVPASGLDVARPLMARDKKATGKATGELRFVLLDGPGRASIVEDVDAATLNAAFAAVTA